MICLWCRSCFRHFFKGWLHTFLSFLSETSKLQSVVYSKWKHFCLTLHCCWIHWEKMISWSRIWSICWHLHSQSCSHNWVAKHKNLLSSSRVITKPHTHFTSFIVSLISSWELGTIARNRSIFPRAFTGTLECPNIKNTIDCACLRSYVRQILAFSSYCKEKAAVSLGLVSNYWLFDWLIDCLTGGRTDWLTDCQTDCQTDGLTDWRTDCLTDWRTDGLSDGRTDGWTDGLTAITL